MVYFAVAVHGSEWSHILWHTRPVLPIVPKCWTVHFKEAPIPEGATPVDLEMLPGPAINWLDVVAYNVLDDTDEPYKAGPPDTDTDDTESD